MNEPQSRIMPVKETLDLLLKRGWFGRYDWAMLIVSIAWPIAAKLWLKEWPVIQVLLVSTVILLFWLIVLCYRIAYFVIIVQVSMDSMPATASRLAVKFLKTTPPNMPGGA